MTNNWNELKFHRFYLFNSVFNQNLIFGLDK